MSGCAPSKDPNKIIDRIYAESVVRECGYIMPQPHCHPYFELFYVDSGACSFFIENNMYELHKGDFMLIPPQVFHYTRYLLGQCRRSNIFFRREDLPEQVRALLPQKEEFFSQMRIFQVPDAYREQIASLIQRMIKEEKINDERSAPMISILLQEMFVLCSRECNILKNMPSEIHTTDRPIVQAAQFIKDRYMDDISTADIACAAGYSPNYLSRKFREAAGIGLHEYLTFIRLQRAALELIETDDTVTQIAMRCGFTDANYFKDAFKKKYGVTPRAYRK